MNTGEQSTIFPKTENKTITVVRNTFTRSCNECGKEYEAVFKNSKFCSDRCYRHALRKNPTMKKNNEPVTPDKKPDNKPDTIPSPQFANLPPHMAIAIDLLKQDSKRWKDLYDEEKEERKKIYDQYAKLKEEMKEQEHKQQLQGIEDKKPDLIDRLGNLPPALIEAFTPIIGRLGSMLIPEAPASAMAGISGQLDEVQLQLITWINSLPENAQKNLLGLLAALTHMDEQKLTITLSQFQNLLVNGSTIGHGQFNESMYAQ